MQSITLMGTNSTNSTNDNLKQDESGKATVVGWSKTPHFVLPPNDWEPSDCDDVYFHGPFMDFGAFVSVS
ncbi:uncharacterized protein EAF02_007150 [Botrytis sinoallii]|uniref:uncharacterized protein n=1 Tax=Botrytis sinoallii TaxID=1463999 RepID=UPI00190280CC|nr:uncharacterized protein EAF02_007150 [Botrytis sinoallii]KAF7880304.1 hypothetical protein EAF02_007150 [Botrytis sinoallii]